MFKAWTIRWIGFHSDYKNWFYWSVFRFNSGYPYESWRFGPILIKRYVH